MACLDCGRLKEELYKANLAGGAMLESLERVRQALADGGLMTAYSVESGVHVVVRERAEYSRQVQQLKEQARIDYRAYRDGNIALREALEKIRSWVAIIASVPTDDAEVSDKVALQAIRELGRLIVEQSDRVLVAVSAHASQGTG